MNKDNEHPRDGAEQLEISDISQLDLKLFTHIGDVPFSAIEDEAIEAYIDSVENE